MRIAKSLPTSLELNGPIISWDIHPTSVSGADGTSLTFTGLATATFPEQDPPLVFANDGTLSYRWYEVGIGSLTDGGRISGAGTTILTISDLDSPGDSGRQFYLTADYGPSAYSQPVGSAVTVGTARSTGNALNENYHSDIASITVFPEIQISEQPSALTVAQGLTAVFTINATLTDTTQGEESYKWQINQTDISDGTIDHGDGKTTVISGSGTDRLVIVSDYISERRVRCKVTHPLSGNSPQYSSDVRYDVVSARQIVNFEYINQNSGQLNKAENINFFDTDEHVLDANNPAITGIVRFYAPERDVTIIMELFAARGFSNGGFEGGEGGYSKIRFTMKQNEEYILNNIPQVNSSGSIFLYYKHNLLAVSAAGGSAGTGGNGGPGGGVGVAGGPGSGAGGGTGGVLWQDGTLPFPGIFGSTAGFANDSGFLVGGDSVANQPLGGRVIPCPRGGYYRQQGFAPCQEVGQANFVTPHGVNVAGTRKILSGFKAGYGVRNTAGAGIGGGGSGGNGATGGNGGINGGGGGGGSGYNSGLVEVLEATQGGNTGIAKVIFSLGDERFIEEDVTFTAHLESGPDHFIEFTLESGEGPATMKFGASSFGGELGDIVKQIRKGSIYKVTDQSGSLRMNGEQLGLEDFSDNDTVDNYDDLTIRVDKGTILERDGGFFYEFF
jgi:hypothetical protein